MELRELEAFVKVVETGSFTRAAEALSLTQPAITRQVANLETEYGAKLLDRLGRRAELTDSGAALYEYANRVLILATESRKAVADVGAGIAGELSIGASSTIATYLLPPILKKFTTEFPNVKLSMFTGPTARVAELVASSNVDLGVLMDHQERDRVNAIALAPYRLVAIVPPAHPLAARGGRIDTAVLAAQQLIVMQPGATLRRSVEAILASIAASLTVSLELDNVESIKKMVAAELGISVVPELAVRSEVEGGLLVALSLRETPLAQQTIWAVHDTTRYQNTAAAKFLSMLQREVT